MTVDEASEKVETALDELTVAQMQYEHSTRLVTATTAELKRVKELQSVDAQKLCNARDVLTNAVTILARVTLDTYGDKASAAVDR